MLFDLADAAVTIGGPFDTIIVGAGAVGLSMAIQLARAGKRVAVFEAGGGSTSSASQAYFETAHASGHDLPGLHMGRFRNLGGTTAFWGGQLVKFDNVVFGDRPWVSSDSWPIALADIDPYYAHAYELLGMRQVLTEDEPVWKRLKVVSPPPSEDIDAFFTRWAPESNFARLFGLEIRDSKLLHVYLNAPVRCLVGGGDCVDGVQIVMPSGHGQAVLGRRMVLANGTVEIARLLQLPMADGAAASWSKNPWIGVGFMDHMDCIAGRIVPIDSKRFSELFDNAYIEGIKYQPKLKLSEATQLEKQLLGIAAHFIFNSSVSEHLGNFKILLKGLSRGRFETRALRNPFKALAAMGFVVPMALRYLRSRRMYNLADRGIQLRLTSEHSPRETSRVTLLNEKDALGMPKVDVGWYFDPKEIETVAVFAEMVRDYLGEHRLATVEIDPRLLARDPAFMGGIDDANHHMGTARMSEEASRGVVDPSMKVHGTRNLFVAGAAVYPTSGFANPTFTAIALGLRLADAIANERV
ncbi:MAG TPA: FAD-dependent oxidoreductase [Devosia sp.]|nr:FAD-dependent oxidoreductase [Devosia sp.]